MNSTLGRWVLEKFGVYHPLTGVTSNQSESFNATLKRLQRWREVPGDALILALFHLQAFYHNEVQSGFAAKLLYSPINSCYAHIIIHVGLGDYKLLSQFCSLAVPPNQIHLISCLSPTEILDHKLKKAHQSPPIEGMEIRMKLLYTTLIIGAWFYR